MAAPNRICPQCGTPLAPNEMFCSNCGTHYTDSASVDPTQRALSQDQGLASSSQPQIEPTQYAGPSSSPSPYGSNPYSNTSYGSPDQNQSYSPPPGAGYTAPPPPNVGYVPPAPLYGSIPGTYGQPFPMQPPPQAKKGANIGLIVGIGLLVLLLIGGSIFFLSRPKSSDTSSGKTTTHSTTPGATSGPQPLFADNFADNSQKWNTGNGSGFSSTVGNNVMALSEANHKILDEPIPGSGNTAATYTNFSATATFIITKADQNDSVGFYMRGDDNLSHGYFVDIFGDNTYDIVKVFPDASKDTFLVSPTSSSAINSVGQLNKLTVIMKGPKIVVLINDKVVNSISDSAYTSGQIALFAENGKSSDGVKATFKNVAVYPAPAQLPA